jgi:beta-1,3-glucuronyltransferase S
MAGFAVNINHLTKYPNATMPYKAGYEEDAFLKSIGLKMDQIEPKANDCTEVYVWHTQTTKTKAPNIKVTEDALEGTNSNLHSLLKTLSDSGVSHFSASGGEFRKIFQQFHKIFHFFVLSLRSQSDYKQGWKSEELDHVGSLNPIRHHTTF